MYARRTVTFDKSRQISDDDWQTLLKVTQNAPTSNGLEPWKILQIDRPEFRKKIQKSRQIWQNSWRVPINLLFSQ